MAISRNEARTTLGKTLHTDAGSRAVRGLRRRRRDMARPHHDRDDWHTQWELIAEAATLLD